MGIMERKMETTIYGLGFRDRICGICGSHHNIPKAIFCLLKGTIRYYKR